MDEAQIKRESIMREEIKNVVLSDKAPQDKLAQLRKIKSNANTTGDCARVINELLEEEIFRTEYKKLIPHIFGYATNNQ